MLRVCSGNQTDEGCELVRFGEFAWPVSGFPTDAASVAFSVPEQLRPHCERHHG
jgi:hypothetical protein